MRALWKQMEAFVRLGQMVLHGNYRLLCHYMLIIKNTWSKKSLLRCSNVKLSYVKLSSVFSM